MKNKLCIIVFIVMSIITACAPKDTQILTDQVEWTIHFNDPLSGAVCYRYNATWDQVACGRVKGENVSAILLDYNSGQLSFVGPDNVWKSCILIGSLYTCYTDYLLGTDLTIDVQSLLGNYVPEQQEIIVTAPPVQYESGRDSTEIVTKSYIWTFDQAQYQRLGLDCYLQDMLLDMAGCLQDSTYVTYQAGASGINILDGNNSVIGSCQASSGNQYSCPIGGQMITVNLQPAQ